MNTFEKFIYFLQGEMPEPKPFGWFHLLWIIILIVLLFIIRNKKEEKDLKIILGTYGIVSLILEILKQVAWSFNYENGVVTWDYQWYAFPFQLCSTPIYVSIVCLFLKDGKVRNMLLSYLAFITLWGGVATIFMPSSCFVEDILVNIHTMYLHCGSVLISLYLLISGRVSITLKNVYEALKVFIIFVFTSLTLDIVMYESGIIGDETFNMFFISPYFISSLPIFDTIQKSVPYIVFLISYILIVSIFAIFTYLLGILIKRILKK